MLTGRANIYSARPSPRAPRFTNTHLSAVPYEIRRAQPHIRYDRAKYLTNVLRKTRVACLELLFWSTVCMSSPTKRSTVRMWGIFGMRRLLAFQRLNAWPDKRPGQIRYMPAVHVGDTRIKSFNLAYYCSHWENNMVKDFTRCDPHAYGGTYFDMGPHLVWFCGVGLGYEMRTVLTTYLSIILFGSGDIVNLSVEISRPVCLRGIYIQIITWRLLCWSKTLSGTWDCQNHISTEETVIWARFTMLSMRPWVYLSGWSCDCIHQYECPRSAATSASKS